MGEQGVQRGAEHAPLWGPSDEDQLSEGVVLPELILLILLSWRTDWAH
jgi:hypothetical protein